MKYLARTPLATGLKAGGPGPDLLGACRNDLDLAARPLRRHGFDRLGGLPRRFGRKGGRQEGVDIGVITDRYTAAYHNDLQSLGVEPTTHEPRVTKHLPQIISMIEGLIGAGHAYAAEGHVLFNVPSYPDYGKLSKRDTREMLAGARVEVAPYKKDPGDFVLWKPSPPELPVPGGCPSGTSWCFAGPIRSARPMRRSASRSSGQFSGS